MPIKQLSTPWQIQDRTFNVRAIDDGAVSFDDRASTFYRVDSYRIAIDKGAFNKTFDDRHHHIPPPSGCPLGIEHNRTSFLVKIRYYRNRDRQRTHG